MLTSLSVAPATTAPLSSATVPETLPPVAANNDAVEKKKATNTKIRRIVRAVEENTPKRSSSLVGTAASSWRPVASPPTGETRDVSFDRGTDPATMTPNLIALNVKLCKVVCFVAQHVIERAR